MVSSYSVILSVLILLSFGKETATIRFVLEWLVITWLELVQQSVAKGLQREICRRGDDISVWTVAEGSSICQLLLSERSVDEGGRLFCLCPVPCMYDLYIDFWDSAVMAF